LRLLLFFLFDLRQVEVSVEEVFFIDLAAHALLLEEGEEDLVDGGVTLARLGDDLVIDLAL